MHGVLTEIVLVTAVAVLAAGDLLLLHGTGEQLAAVREPVSSRAGDAATEFGA
jgi:hypothetical protein